MTAITGFTIRVYGLLINSDKEILLVHERTGDFSFTKFPGGGLEPGEGLRDCLKREFMEEAGLDITVGAHFYTTDFFQQSAFRKTDQIISVYYRIEPLPEPFHIRTGEFEIVEDGKPEYLRFFWVPLQSLKEDHVTFPIDRLVCRMLAEAGPG